MAYKKRTFRSYSPAFDFSTPNDRKRSNTVPVGNVSAALNRDIFRAPYETLIDQISVVVSVALPTDAVNFWQFDVKLISAVTGVVGASILTAAIQIKTGLAANTNLDLAVASNVIIGPNDVLQLQMVETGNAVNLADLIVVVDWEVTGITTTTSTSSTTSTTTTTSTSTSSTTTTTTTVSTTTTLT